MSQIYKNSHWVVSNMTHHLEDWTGETSSLIQLSETKNMFYKYQSFRGLDPNLASVMLSLWWSSVGIYFEIYKWQIIREMFVC